MIPQSDPGAASAEEDRDALAALGRDIGPAMMRGVHALYDGEQRALADRYPPAAADLAYGSDPRQVLDLYAPRENQSSGRRPVLVFVHGGGFRRGAKSDPDHPFEANVGRFAAQRGMLGAVINYRLAPAHVFPAGGEDVGLAVDWLRAHAADFGGDPRRIVLVGTSAGAAHVATLLKLRPSVAIAGAAFLSGLYGIQAYDDPERDLLYFGTNVAGHAGTVTADALVASRHPMLVACAEHDPPRFQAEFVGLLARFVAAGKRLPAALVAADHNHFSLAMHLGTRDRRVGDMLEAFVRRACASASTEEKTR